LVHVGVHVAVRVWVIVGVLVQVLVGGAVVQLGDGLELLVGVGVHVPVVVGVLLGVAVAEAVGVLVGGTVGEDVGVEVDVAGASVAVGVAVAVGGGMVGVAVSAGAVSVAVGTGGPPLPVLITSNGMRSWPVVAGVAAPTRAGIGSAAPGSESATPFHTPVATGGAQKSNELLTSYESPTLHSDAGMQLSGPGAPQTGIETVESFCQFQTLIRARPADTVLGRTRTWLTVGRGGFG